jgi:hypothetical protein
MSERDLEWRPGSFSKNFSWGQTEGGGLEQLHRAIRAGFAGKLAPVERDAFRAHAQDIGLVDLIPANFFLFNFIAENKSWIAVDELVFVALTRAHDRAFDRLAVFALNFSKVGVWKGAASFQRYPALWAKYYIIDEIARPNGWRTDQISADHIEQYLQQHMTFRSDSPRKFATNLNDIYRRAGMGDFENSGHESWWGHAVFLALDRLLMDEEGMTPTLPPTDELIDRLGAADFWTLTALDASIGQSAAFDLVELYRALGGPSRFFIETSAPLIVEGITVPPLAVLEEASRSADLVPIARTYVQAQRLVRDRRVVLYLKRLYEDRCCLCGKSVLLDESRRYSEAGHVWPVGKPFEGPDHPSNVLIFCPNHHKAFDYGAAYLVAAGGDYAIRSAVGDNEIDGGVFTPKPEHGLNPEFVSKHAGHFLRD